jgi:hypothetical protein
MTCSQATTTWQNGAPGFAILPMPPSPNGPPSLPFVETLHPHMWYFTMAVDCSQNVQLSSYTLDLRLADGSQLGYDEIGMPAIYGVFWAIYLVGTLAHAYVHYWRAPRFAPVLVKFFTGSLALITVSLFCKMIDWSTAASNGVGVPAMSMIGDLLRVASLMALWIVCALAASGYGIVTYKLDEKNYAWVGWLLLVSLLVAYLTLVIYFAVDVDPRSSGSFGSIWPAITLLAITLMYAGWWSWKIRATYTAEVNTTKKVLLKRLGYALVGNFFVLPVAYIVGAATPVYERTRVATGFDIFIITCINAASVWALWPSNAQDAFRVYDGSTSVAMLGSDMDAADFHASLDEAYSYSAAPDGAREYSGAV